MTNVSNTTPEQQFWNDPAIVEEFAQYPAPPYWADFLKTLNNPRSLKALDMGCGGGRNTELLLSFGFDTYACDVHEGMVKATAERMARILNDAGAAEQKVRKASFLKLPYADGEFDVLVASGVLHNTETIEEELTGIAEVARVLKSDGYACINVFYQGVVPEELKPAREDGRVFFTREGLYMTLLTKEELLSALEKNGLVPVGEVATYESNVNTGVRSVFRAVFKKN